MTQEDEEAAYGGLGCSEIVALVTEYLEDAMEPPVRARFEAHIAGCGACAEYLGQMRATIAATGRLAEEIPEQTLGALRDAFRGWRDTAP